MNPISSKSESRCLPRTGTKSDAEWVWAKPLGEGLYRLDNIPAFVPGLALDDVIAAEDEDGVPVFRGVRKRAGHSTYWLFFSNDVERPQAANFLSQLESLGCSYEGVRGRMIAVDVEPEPDIHQVYSFFQKAESEGLMQFEEGHCGHVLRAINPQPMSEQVKIKIPLSGDNLMNADAEWVWAEPRDDGNYTIANVPFLAMGLSYNDVVEAELNDGALIFKGVVQHCGHSTYRIYASAGRSNPAVCALLDRIHRMNCDIEPATEKLLAIDVLPGADIHSIYAVLSDAEEAGVIGFEEGHCGHPMRSIQ